MTLLSILTIFFLGVAFVSFGIFAGMIGRIIVTAAVNNLQDTLLQSAMNRKGCH